MKIYSICCTYNRHKLLERAVSCFLQQDYEGEHKLLIYNNSPHKLRMDGEYENIVLFNNHISIRTGHPYDNTGDVFSDALRCVPESVDVINFEDDDDLYKSNHISEGIKGMEEAISKGMLAYKPKYSYFRYAKEPEKLDDNTMEPSIFVDRAYVQEKGFKHHSSDYHSQWTAPLFKDKLIYTKKNGIPTFIYDWSEEAKAFKISGNGEDPNNFNNHKKNSNDIGDAIITPYKIIV